MARAVAAAAMPSLRAIQRARLVMAGAPVVFCLAAAEPEARARVAPLVRLGHLRLRLALVRAMAVEVAAPIHPAQVVRVELAASPVVVAAAVVLAPRLAALAATEQMVT